MRDKLLLLGAYTAFVGSVIAGAQELRERHTPRNQAEMHARVLALYNFHPAQVTEAERGQKSKEMDIFWSEMKAEPDKSLPLLRCELQDTSDPPFFFTDGTELLLSLSKARANEELVATVLPRVDLSDTQTTAYFYEVHELAADGIDVTAGALHILDDPHFFVSVPQHAMTLDQRMSLMYVLLSMDETLWMKAAEQRFAVEKDAKAREALLFAIFYAETDEGARFMMKVADDTSESEALRKQAQSFVKEDREVGRTFLPVKGSLEELRRKRRERLRAVSDEAIGDVQGMTKKIAELRAKTAKQASPQV